MKPFIHENFLLNNKKLKDFIMSMLKISLLLISIATFLHY